MNHMLRPGYLKFPRDTHMVPVRDRFVWIGSREVDGGQGKLQMQTCCKGSALNSPMGALPFVCEIDPTVWCFGD